MENEIIDSDSNIAERKLLNFKIWHIFLILTIVSILLYFGTYYISSFPGWQFLKLPLFKDIANACSTTLIIGFTYEWYIRAESKNQLVQSIELALRKRKKDISE